MSETEFSPNKFQLNLLEKTTLILIASFVGLGVIFAHINHGYFKYHYVAEDGMIENLTVVAMLLCSLISFSRLWQLKANKNNLFLFFLFLMGCFFFFVAGEEISWGQRIFNIQSSEFFSAHNAQQETNLHNLVVAGTKLNKLIFSKILMLAAIFYLLILPPLYRKKPSVKAFFDKIAIPIPQKYQVIAFLALLILTELSFSSKKGELLEFGGTFLMLLIVAKPYNLGLYQRG